MADAAERVEEVLFDFGGGGEAQRVAGEAPRLGRAQSCTTCRAIGMAPGVMLNSVRPGRPAGR